jgi:hypothetical protein
VRKAKPSADQSTSSNAEEYPSGTGCVIIVTGEKDPPLHEQLRADLVKATERSGVRILKVIRSVQYRVIHGDDTGRPLPLINPEDARWMYEAFHRYDVAVLALRAAYVRVDPSMDPARLRRLIPLERFVRYKAYHGSIRSAKDIGIHLEQFELSRSAMACDGVDDPRVLPLHIFYCENDWPGLASTAEQQRFTREHGPSNRRQDCSGLNWRKPKGQAARHGGPALRVARRTLEQGFHWDVSSGPDKTIYSADAVWVLKERRSYINIYPNGYIRAPGRRYGTVRRWP